MSNMSNSTQKRSIDSNWMYVKQVRWNAVLMSSVLIANTTLTLMTCYIHFIVIPAWKDISVEGMCESCVFDVCLISNMSSKYMEITGLQIQMNWMHVDHVGQKASINNMISKSKFLNKDILQFNLWITTKFELKWPKTSIYSHFELAKG